MSNLSNCFSYLGINFYEKDIPEKIPKNFNLFIKFIHALDFTYSQQFLKNLGLLHNFHKFCQQVPSLETIFKIFESNFIKKAINSKCYFIKNWNEEMIYFLVWMISVCEILFYKSFYEFTTYEWQIISNLLPKSDAESLKYKWFTLISSIRSPEWNKEEDDSLMEILRETDENLFVSNFSGVIDIKWSKVALDLSKRSNKSTSFKTSKQCRERWLNHLNPFLNKEIWSQSEDIKLLEESLSKKKSWSEISKSFPGRTQHTVKNRFLAVMGKEMVLSRTAIRSILKKMNNEQLISEVLNKLRSNTSMNSEIDNETIEPAKEVKKQNISILSKRNFCKMELDSPSLTKKIKRNVENLPVVETNSGSSTYESNSENKENSNLLEILADKFNFWKETEEEEKKSTFNEDSDNGNTGNTLFNVDDFFSI